MTVSNGGFVSQFWGVQWRSCNRLDGKQRQLMGDGFGVAMRFRTRAEARKYIQEQNGYIKERKDLRVEPHGWRMPVAVRIEVTSAVVPIKNGED